MSKVFEVFGSNRFLVFIVFLATRFNVPEVKNNKDDNTRPVLLYFLGFLAVELINIGEI